MDKVRIEVPNPTYLQDDTDIYSRIKNDIESVNVFKQNKDSRGEENYSWYKGEQWTAEEVASHAKQGRVAYVFNEILNKIDNLLGAEKQLRFEAKVTPRELGDNRRTDLLSYLIKWAEQINQIDVVQSEAFQDAVIKGAGCVVIRWDVSDVEYGFPSVEKIPINEMFWDGDSKDPNLEDARWIARVMKTTKLAAAEMYPKHFELIDDALTYDTTYGIYTVPSYREKIKEKHGYWYANEGRDEISIIEHYEKFKAFQYIVVDEISGNVYKEDTYKEANEIFAGLVDTYTENGEPIVTGTGEQMVYLHTINTTRLMQTIIIGDKVAERNILALPTFPYKILFTYFNNGDYFAVVDNMILPQLFTNRLIAQWDYSIGTSIKNGFSVKENLLRRGYTLEDLRSDISKTGTIIPVIAHEALQPLHNGGGVQPQLFSGVEFGINRIAEYGGGRNMMGMAEGANESGAAVQARTQQAGVARMTIFDRLSQWRKSVTELMAWWIINYMTPAQILRIIGKETSVQYTELDVYLVDSLEELRYDITIDEVNKSDAIKDRNFEQMWRLFSQIPALEPYEMMNLLLPFTSIPESQKDQIKEHIIKHREYLAQVSQTQKMDKIKQEAEDALVRRKIKEQLLQDEQYQTAEDAEKLLKKQAELGMMNQQEQEVPQPLGPVL